MNRQKDMIFHPADLKNMQIGVLSHLLRHDPEGTRRKIRSGEWSVENLDEAIRMIENYELSLKKNNPAWQPPAGRKDLREMYSDLLTGMKRTA